MPSTGRAIALARQDATKHLAAVGIDEIDFVQVADELALLQREIDRAAIGSLPESGAFADHRFDQMRHRTHADMPADRFWQAGRETGIVVNLAGIEIV